jgi:hypothetical protein
MTRLLPMLSTKAEPTQRNFAVIVCGRVRRWQGWSTVRCPRMARMPMVARAIAIPIGDRWIKLLGEIGDRPMIVSVGVAEARHQSAAVAINHGSIANRTHGNEFIRHGLDFVVFS